MSANPPITSIPAAQADPQNTIERYRILQQSYAAYYAQLGREELETPVGPYSFANHLPPTPNRSVVLSQGGSGSSRSRGMVARMQPKESQLKAQKAAPTPAPTSAPKLKAARALPVVAEDQADLRKLLVSQIKSKLEIQPLPSPPHKKRKAPQPKKQLENNKRAKTAPESENEVDETKAALLRQRLGRRRAKAAILKSRPIYERELADSEAEKAGPQQDLTKRRIGEVEVDAEDSGDGNNRGGRLTDLNSMWRRGRGSQLLAQFRANNVGGTDGRITVNRPRGFLSKGKTSIKVTVPSVHSAITTFPVFDEIAFLNNSAIAAATPRQPTPDASFTNKAPSEHFELARPLRLLTPVIMSQAGPTDDPGPSGVNQMLPPSFIDGQKPDPPLRDDNERSVVLPLDAFPEPPPRTVSHYHTPRPRRSRRPRRTIFHLPVRTTTTPCFGESSTNLPGYDILGFLTPRSYRHQQEAEREAYLEELSLQSFEEKMWPQEAGFEPHGEVYNELHIREEYEGPGPILRGIRRPWPTL